MAVQKGQNGLSVSHSRNISIKNHSLSQVQNQKKIIQTPKKQNGSKIKEERKATPHGSPAQSEEGIYDQIQNGNQTYILQRQRVSRQQKTLDERMVMVDKDLTKLKKSLGKNAVLGRSTSLPQNLIALGERYTSASKDQLKQLISNEPKRKSRSIQRENSLLELYSVKSLEDEIVDTEKSDLALQKNLEMKIQPKDFALKSKNELLSGIIAEDNTSKSNAAEEEDPTTIRQAQRNSTSHNGQPQVRRPMPMFTSTNEAIDDITNQQNLNQIIQTSALQVTNSQNDGRFNVNASIKNSGDTSVCDKDNNYDIASDDSNSSLGQNDNNSAVASKNSSSAICSMNSNTAFARKDSNQVDNSQTNANQSNFSNKFMAAPQSNKFTLSKRKFDLISNEQQTSFLQNESNSSKRVQLNSTLNSETFLKNKKDRFILQDSNKVIEADSDEEDTPEKEESKITKLDQVLPRKISLNKNPFHTVPSQIAQAQNKGLKNSGNFKRAFAFQDPTIRGTSSNANEFDAPKTQSQRQIDNLTPYLTSNIDFPNYSKTGSLNQNIKENHSTLFEQTKQNPDNSNELQRQSQSGTSHTARIGTTDSMMNENMISQNDDRDNNLNKDIKPREKSRRNKSKPK
eukprot:403331072